MDDLVTWLGVQLDGDERVARAAVAPFLKGRWRFDGTLSSVGPVVVTGDATDDRWVRDGNKSVWTCDDPEDSCSEIAALWDAEGEHMARWDPARVLAEVEAKRAILDEFRRELADDLTNESALWVLAVLALPYRDRPGYRPEWAPDR